MDEKRKLSRGGLLWIAGYLALCGLAYLLGVWGNTDGSGLSFLWLALVLLPWIFGWAALAPEAPFWLILSSCIGLNSWLIWWGVRIAQRPRIPRPPRRRNRKWRVEVRGGSVEIVRRADRARRG